jgi:hypothetical protein
MTRAVQFCNSHLLMRIDITTKEEPSESLFPDAVDTNPSTFNNPAHMADYTKLPEDGSVVDQELGADAIAEATRKALDGNHDRRLRFKRQGDYWVMGDNAGWDHNIKRQSRAVVADDDQEERDKEHGTHLIAENVGQNFIEIWQLKSGGGWVHPVRCLVGASMCRTVTFRVRPHTCIEQHAI